MSLRDGIGEFENDAKVLERIASQFDETSIEHAALKRAAIALWLALTTNYQGFKECLINWEGGLTREQRSHLKGMGIDPDRDPG
jgi:hypothetical protein